MLGQAVDLLAFHVWLFIDVDALAMVQVVHIEVHSNFSWAAVCPFKAELRKILVLLKLDGCIGSIMPLEMLDILNADT